MSRRSLALFGLIFGGLLAAWSAVSGPGGVPSYLLPAPLDVAGSAWDNSRDLIAACGETLLITLAGSLLALTAALVLAIASFFVARNEGSVVGLLIVLQSIPVIVLAPLLNIWLGNAALGRILISAMFALFPLAISFMRSLQEAPADMVMFARAVGCGRRQLLCHVLLQWAWGGFFTGLRVAVPLALVGAIVAELSGADRGVGFLMQQAQRRLDMELLFAAVFCTAGLGLTGYSAIILVERLAIPWRRSSIDP